MLARHTAVDAVDSFTDDSLNAETINRQSRPLLVERQVDTQRTHNAAKEGPVVGVISAFYNSLT